MEKKGFIAWSGKTGLPLAEALKKVFKNTGITIELSSDIDIGTDWYQAIQDKLGEVDFGIGCLTPGASIKPWLNFEAGTLFGRLENFKIVLLGNARLHGPMERIQAIKGELKSDFVKLLKSVYEGTGVNAVEIAEERFAEWKRVLNLYDEQLRYESEIEAALEPLIEAANVLKDNEHVRKNKCLRLIINKSVNNMTERMKATSNFSYSVPASQYPHYLVSLQEKLKAKVNAVALVDQQETFWLQDVGRKILNLSKLHSENGRVFVFMFEADYNKNIGLLQQHANVYNVWVISQSKLFTDFPMYTKDFAVIEADDKSKLLAVYDREEIEKILCYSTDQMDINKHQDAFEKIKGIARKVSKETTLDELDEIRQDLFGNLTPYDRKAVEMSSYISVKDYDKHEEKHAYFIPMMERMIEICEDHRQSHPPLLVAGRCRVLELGAGTGIFTKRLAQIPGLDIFALEIDWECFKRLRYNLLTNPDEFHNPEKLTHQAADSAKGKIELLHEDSRTYNPPGKFSYIFSSFSDHHIKSKDKQQYFKNVRRNLLPGGLFIVGDEFLRPIKSAEEIDRDKALSEYHQHIIKKAHAKQAEIISQCKTVSDESQYKELQAEANGYGVLAQLENDALQSGLNKQGDFKLSLEEYEHMLHQAGFHKYLLEKIGPLDNDYLPEETVDGKFIDIGGVYVYTIQS